MQQELEEYLLKSGEHAELAEYLRERLEDSGWYDSVRALAIQEVSSAKDPSTAALAASIEPRAISMVPENIKIEMIKLIKSIIDPLVEKA